MTREPAPHLVPQPSDQPAHPPAGAATPAADAGGWRKFSLWFTGSAIALTAALSVFTLAMDPYGVRASPSRPATAIMDVNQRYMYPQVVRSGQFDSAVFGASTVRLLNPQRLDAETGATFANMAMNAATPWEQTQLAQLFLRHTPQAKAIVFGLDANWCDADADAESKRLTFRSFPPWLYAESRTLDFAHMFDFQSLEIATRVAANRLGFAKDRIRRDGYEVFTPPENLYDLTRARGHIWAGAPDLSPQTPAEVPNEAERASWRFPATGWMAELLRAAPEYTRIVMVFPPVHVAAQPRPGSREAARQDACKAAFAKLGAAHGASVVDLRFANEVTTRDDNYWDNLHYRLPIAERLTDVVIRALRGAPETDLSFARRTVSGRRNAVAPGAQG